MSLSPDQKLAAYLLGRRIAGQRRKQERVPVAYLYNGVRLPGLPKEWNPVTHPFAYVYLNSTGKNVLMILSGPLEWQPYYMWGYANVSAHFYVQAESEWTLESSNDNATGSIGELPIWSNVDLVKNGEVALAGSNPVPVYE